MPVHRCVLFCMVPPVQLDLINLFMYILQILSRMRED